MTLFSILLAMVFLAGPRFDNIVFTRPLNPPAGPLYQVFELEPVDVLHYDLQIDINIDDETIDGTAGITLLPTQDELTEFKLYLKELQVTQVAGAADFSQSGDSLFIILPEAVSQSDTVDLSVSYNGAPAEESWGGFHFWDNAVFSMGEVFIEDPSAGKYFFPCHDRISDKATFDFHLTVPDTLYAVANGDSAGVTDNMNGTLTYHWSLSQPMSTYLAAVSVSDYVVLHDSTDSRLFYYVYSWDVEDALGSYADVDIIMELLEERYGSYPWNCRLGIVETPTGDMEHVSQVYHIEYAVNGSTDFNWLLAHEMAHHWWGNCITEETWTDLWLAESFATYSEAIWYETQGLYRDYVVEYQMKPYLNSGEIFPIADPQTPAELWGYTTYQKGAVVLYMLRGIMGDSAFFAGLNTYFQDNMFGSVTTPEFITYMEDQYGDLGWFFDQWVYGPGYPVYDIQSDWIQNGSQWDLTLEIGQIQPFENFFTMPVEFLVEGSAEDTLISFLNDQQNQENVFALSFEPVSVTFDPEQKILSTAVLGVEEEFSPPVNGVSTMYLYPNPATVSAAVQWMGTGEMVLEATVFDLSGREVRNAVLQPGSRNLDLADIPSGTYIVRVNAPGNISQSARMTVLNR